MQQSISLFFLSFENNQTSQQKVSNMISSLRILQVLIIIVAFILITFLLTACGDLPSDESMEEAFNWGGVAAFFIGAWFFIDLYTR